VTVRPDRGPVGSHVHLETDGLTGGYWQQVSRTNGGGYGVFLIGPGATPGCELIVGDQASITISPSGHLMTDFTIPLSGRLLPVA
jgi:hypothetical protein